jgi:nitrate/nitrite transporter NarK
MFLYASELFPTVLRGVAMGHCGFWGRVGSLIAPQLLFLVSVKLQLNMTA